MRVQLALQTLELRLRSAPAGPLPEPRAPTGVRRSRSRDGGGSGSRSSSSSSGDRTEDIPAMALLGPGPRDSQTGTQLRAASLTAVSGSAGPGASNPRLRARPPAPLQPPAPPHLAAGRPPRPAGWTVSEARPHPFCSRRASPPLRGVTKTPTAPSPSPRVSGCGGCRALPGPVPGSQPRFFTCTFQGEEGRPHPPSCLLAPASQVGLRLRAPSCPGPATLRTRPLQPQTAPGWHGVPPRRALIPRTPRKTPGNVCVSFISRMEHRRDPEWGGGDDDKNMGTKSGHRLRGRGHQV